LKIVKVQLVSGNVVLGFTNIEESEIDSIYFDEVSTKPQVMNCYCYIKDKEGNLSSKIYLYQDSLMQNPVNIKKIDI